MHQLSTSGATLEAGSGFAPTSEAASDVRARMNALLLGSRSAAVLYAAAEVDLFGSLRDGPKSAEEVAALLGLDYRATAIVLEALYALGILERHGSRYANGEYAGRALLKDAPESVFHNLRYQARVWAGAGTLTKPLRVGQPDADLLARLRDAGFTRDYILGMRELATVMAPEVAAHLADLPWRDVLDVGAGPGSYSSALLERRPRARVTLFDLPGTLAVTRDLLAEHPAAEQLDFHAGNYLSDDFGAEAFDLVLLSHVTHDESAEDNERLLRRAFAALRPRGRVAIHDFVLPAGPRPRLFPTLFAVHLLVYTARGRVYREEEYTHWLETAGFRDLARHRVGAGYENESLLLVGTRPD